MRGNSPCWIMTKATAILAAALIMGGCDLDEDKVSDHVPPAGQGALIVDNQTPTDLDVYLDGELQGEVDAFDDKTWDLAPGVYRLVVDEQDGDRNYATDLDILDGRNTVLDVMMNSPMASQYNVLLTIE
jgi:hypothetical protein